MDPKRIFLVTGVTSDVAIVFLKRLEARGESCQVVGQYRNLNSSIEQLNDSMEVVDLRLMKCDLSSTEDTERWIADLKEEGFFPTDIVHLAARKLQYLRIKEYEWERFEDGLKIQLNSLCQICKAFLPAMAKRRSGRVVAVLSSCTLGSPPKFLAEYVMTKYALLGFIKAAAIEYGGKGVRINGISPGMMETKFLDEVDPRLIEMNAKRTLLGRNITVDETCAAIEYLLSNDAEYINGINLDLSGGEQV